MVNKKTKLFVLDTNVLLHDPSCLYRFEEHDIYLPMVTLEELDNIKKGGSEVARNARQTSRFIEEIIADTETNLDQGCILDKFSKNLEKYYDTQVYQSFYHKCLQMLTDSIQKNLLEEDYHITMLAGAIVFYQIKQFEFSNFDIEDVCNIFNVKPSNIMKYYQILNEK